MQPCLSSSVSERLDRLEGENRRLKSLLLACVVGTVTLGILGAVGNAVPKVAEAEKFVVRDKDGKIRAILGQVDDGEFGLNVLDPEGVARVSLSDAPVGAGLDIWSRDGITHALLLAAEKQIASLELSTRNGGRIDMHSIGVDEKRAEIDLNNGAGTNYVHVFAGSSPISGVTAGVRSPDRNEGSSISIGTNEDNTLDLRLAAINEKGEDVRATLGMDKSGSAFMRLHDKNKTTLIDVPKR